MSRDFSRKTSGTTFTADGDTFQTVPAVAALLIGEVVAKIQAAEGLEAKIESVTEFFDITLVDRSAALMKERLRSKDNPIDLAQALDIVNYLVEEIAQRPTEPSQSSSGGSATEATGTPSTDGAPHEVSIPTTSPSIGTATSYTTTS
jgi:hypothetical protein